MENALYKYIIIITVLQASTDICIHKYSMSTDCEEVIFIAMLWSLQVCELDIIFNFEKAYFMLDELMLGGEIQETSKKNVLKAIQAQDLLSEVRPL